MSSLLIGMFDSQTEAAAARTNLLAAGFAAGTVSMTGAAPEGAGVTGPTTTAAAPAESAHEGGVSGWFKSLFGDDDDVAHAGYTDTYGEAIRRGGYGVSVRAADDTEMDQAERILNECGAVDINEKVDAWRKDGWTGGDVASGSPVAGGAAAATGSLAAGETQKLQEVEEELIVGKRAVARGGVRIFSRMTERPVEETVRLREEHANVQRTAVDRPATEADFAAFKEGVLEVREMGEEAVVRKTARVTGEVSIGKDVSEHEETVRDTVRQTHVEVEQIDGGATTAGAAMMTGATGATGYAGTTGSPNRDPLTGAPGAHPIGTAVGATAGGVAAGAAVGTMAGPVGTVIGAAVGAVAGGLAGKGAAEVVDPTTNPTSSAAPKKPL